MNFLQQQWTICKSYFPARLSLTTLTKCSGVVTNFFVYLLFQQSMVSFISELIAWLSHTLLSKSQSRLEPFGLYSYQKGRNKICVLPNFEWLAMEPCGHIRKFSASSLTRTTSTPKVTLWSKHFVPASSTGCLTTSTRNSFGLQRQIVRITLWTRSIQIWPKSTKSLFSGILIFARYTFMIFTPVRRS